MKDTKLEQECPHCFYRMDRAGDISNQRGPGPGDLTMCLKCGKFSVFDNDMDLERIPDAILESLPPETVAQMATFHSAWEKTMAEFQQPIPPTDKR